MIFYRIHLHAKMKLEKHIKKSRDDFDGYEILDVMSIFKQTEYNSNFASLSDSHNIN